MRTSIVVVGLFATASALVQASEPLRTFSGGVFESSGVPALRVRIDPGFEYLGNDQFLLKDVARVDRHYWVRAADHRVEAMIVMQFEGYIDDVEGSYRFSIPEDDAIAGSNYRFSPERVELGHHRYVHNTWAYDNLANARENPGAESDRTLQLLAARGYELDDGLIMSRYVRAVGEERRNEVILFYIEPLAVSGHTLAEFPDGGPPSADFDRLSDAVTARGRAAFQVLDESR